jgi:signal transduction histidine kinase
MIAGGNTGEAVFGAYMATVYAGGRRAFEDSEHVFSFAFFTGIIATTVSASVGVLTLTAAELLPTVDFWNVWSTWWIGDVAGAMIVTPAILAWANNWRLRWRVDRAVEFAAICLAVLIASQLIFTRFFELLHDYPLASVALPLIAWATIRFSLRETATIIALFSSLALFGTLQGYGPFIDISESLNNALLRTQIFLCINAVTFQLLSVVVESHRKKVEELRDADRKKDLFIATLAHELRNPLAPVVSYLELLQLPSVPEEEKRHALSGITTGVHRITQLLDDLLDIARVRLGRVRLEKKRIDFCSVVTRSVESTRPLFEEKRHTLRVYIPSHPLWVVADPLRMEQVIVNVLTNAAKYTDPGGVVGVVIDASKDVAQVAVHDSGRGIHKEQLKNIFDLYNQGDNGNERQNRIGGGMGIGLRLAKVFIEAHGGFITASSKGPRHGSVFTIAIPLAQHEDSPAESVDGLLKT